MTTIASEKDLMLKADFKHFEGLPYQIENLNKHFEKDGIVHDIKEQVKSTNGRVKKLEIFKAYAVGALAIINVIILPMALYLIKDYMDYNKNLDKKVIKIIEEKFNIPK